jgi:two-component system chemotaxis sensor kinase CheA
MSILDQMRGEFLAEAGELLDEIQAGLLELETHGTKGQPDLVNAVMRSAHSLKGSSGMFGLDDLAQASHSLEGMLEDLEDGRVLDAQSLLGAGLDLVEVMRAFLDEAGGAGATREGAGSTDSREPDPSRSQATNSARPGAPSAAEHQFLRVDLTSLDRALDLVGNLVLETAVLRDLQKELRHGPGHRGVCQRQVAVTRLMERRLGELRECLLTMRMVPLGRVFSRLGSLAGSVGRAKGKQARVVIEGAETSLDKGITERLNDPLTHLIRNAVDHGIETPEERQRKGKPPEGRVTLRAFREGAQVVIEVSDDGRGIDREKVLRKARERGLATEDAQPTDRQLLDHLCTPGLSTADQVDDISGRGVGMDVVRTNVSRLSGTIGLRSEPGLGTTITIRVPPTLSTMDALLVGVGGRVLAVPFHAVREVVRVPESEREAVLEAGALTVRKTLVPIVPLGAIVGVGSTTGRERFAVVVGSGGEQCAVLVDGLGERTEVLVKPLAPRLEGLRGLTGVTELADGRVALVLDAISVMEGVESGDRTRPE